MVVIRLARAGAKKNPFYHMVVTDSRSRRDSNYVEKLGYFNPVARGQEIALHINLEKVQYWQNVGAKLSDRVQALVKKYKKEHAIAQEPVVKKAGAKPKKSVESAEKSAVVGEKKIAKSKTTTPAKTKTVAKKTTAAPAKTKTTTTKKAASQTKE